MHEAAEEKVGQPLSEVVVEEVNDFLDVHKPTLATIEGDVRDAKKRIALAKPRSRPAPKVEPEPASSDEGSAFGVTSDSCSIRVCSSHIDQLGSIDTPFVKSPPRYSFGLGSHGSMRSPAFFDVQLQFYRDSYKYWIHACDPCVI